MIWVRSFIFNIAFYSLTFFWCLSLIWALLSTRQRMMVSVCAYLRVVRAMERRILNLDYDVVGLDRVPPGPVIVAAKHQSAWETMKLHLILQDDPTVVLKRELMSLPFWGWYARKAEMIPVDRGAGASAVSGMIEGAKKAVADGRKIVIFPQGTRTAPGAWRRYRPGVAALYEHLGLPVVPVALNSGMFWGRRRFLKSDGRVTVEFLEPIAPGLPPAMMMDLLVDRLETATDRLVTAVGGPSTNRPVAAAEDLRRHG